MDLATMIATRAELKADIEWKKRVIHCGDRLSRERAEEALPTISKQLVELESKIEYEKNARRARLKRYLAGAVVTFTILTAVGLAQRYLTHPLAATHR